MESRDIGDKPWLNEDGTVKSRAELKAISRQWDAAIWSAYLESIESPATESLFKKPDSIKRYAAEKSVWNLDFGTTKLGWKRLWRLRFALSRLSTQERRAMSLKFWHGMTEMEIARELNLTRRSTRVVVGRALSKIKRILEGFEKQTELQDRRSKKLLASSNLAS